MKDFISVTVLILIAIGWLYYNSEVRSTGWCHTPHLGKCYVVDTMDRVDKLEKKMAELEQTMKRK